MIAAHFITATHRLKSDDKSTAAQPPTRLAGQPAWRPNVSCMLQGGSALVSPELVVFDACCTGMMLGRTRAMSEEMLGSGNSTSIAPLVSIQYAVVTLKASSRESSEHQQLVLSTSLHISSSQRNPSILLGLATRLSSFASVNSEGFRCNLL